MEQWSSNGAQINEGGRSNKPETVVVVASHKKRWRFEQRRWASHKQRQRWTSRKQLQW